VAAQLTGLKQLVLGGLPWVSNPVMLQLTALTALEGVLLSTWSYATPTNQHDVLELHSKVCHRLIQMHCSACCSSTACRFCTASAIGEWEVGSGKLQQACLWYEHAS
jgi:hypothetical protein